MEDGKRKLLTGFLGERWVDPYFSITCHDGSVPSKTVDPNRTFTTWDDLGALKEKILEIGEWDDFVCFTSATYLKMETYDDCICNYCEEWVKWLIDPSRFCSLVAEWLEERE